MRKKINKKEVNFANEFLRQKMRNPALAVANTNRHIVTMESAKQLSAKHLAQPAVRELLDKMIEAKYLIQKHKALLEQKQTVVAYDSKSGQVISEITDIPDPNVILKALDIAYKLKGMYAPEQHENINVNLEARAKDNPQLVQITEEYEEKLRNIFAQGKNNNKSNDTTNNTISTGDSDEDSTG